MPSGHGFGSVAAAMMQVRMPDVTAFHGSLDLKSRFPAGSPQSKAWNRAHVLFNAGTERELRSSPALLFV